MNTLPTTGELFATNQDSPDTAGIRVDFRNVGKAVGVGIVPVGVFVGVHPGEVGMGPVESVFERQRPQGTRTRPNIGVAVRKFSGVGEQMSGNAIQPSKIGLDRQLLWALLWALMWTLMWASMWVWV